MPEQSDSTPRQVVFVVGSGRSGTSTIAGALQTLGLRVPQPEVQADDTNPKGFGEPQWAVDFHDELLQRCQVQVSDARPSAWFDAGKLATDEQLRTRVTEWLEGQFADAGPELVVKDPRLAWFMGLWRSGATRAGATSSYITMLRPVTEVVGSKQKYYDSKFGEVNRTAAWVNMMLHTERATRGSLRRFVRYHDLISDWTVPVFELGEAFGLGTVTSASANDIRKVHQFIDPNLRRVQLTWDDVDVPARLREIAEETWQALDRVVDPEQDGAQVQETFDQLRTEYAGFYAECEAVAQSSVIAARRQARGPKKGPGPGPAPVKAAPPTPGQSRVDKIPHGVRAMVPASARRGLRKALGRER